MKTEPHAIPSVRRGTMFRYELGLLYNPQVSNETARDSLKTMIKGSKTLLDKLLATGFKVESGGKLTPRQVKIIMEHLGEP